MSLMHLLAVGSTLKGIQDEPHRYRDVTAKNLMPKFAVTKPRASNETLATDNTISTIPVGRASAASGARDAASSVHPAKPVEEKSATYFGSLAALVYGQRGKWFLPKPRTSMSASSSGASMTTGFQAVQAELTLDNVKVVRNDLNDADLEVVPALRPGPMGREESTWVTAPKRDMDPSAWSRATAKFIAAFHL